MTYPRIRNVQNLNFNDSWSGPTVVWTAGENLAIGEACYLKASDSKFWKANASSLATMPCVVLAVEEIPANNMGQFLIFGFLRHNSWSWTPGGFLYVSTTPGIPTHVRPSVTGEQVQILGIGMMGNILYFLPSIELVEIS